MIDKKLIWIIALFLLPNFVLSATYIKDVRVWDNSGLDDIIGEGSEFHVQATVNLDGDDNISSDQVTLGDHGIHVDACTNLSDGFVCIYSEGLSTPLKGGEYSMSVSLYDDAHNLVTTLEHSYLVDAIGPNISVSSQRPFTNGNSMNVTLKIKDMAYNGSDACSGIRYLYVSINGKNVKSLNFSDNACSKQLSLHLTPDSSDEQTVCAYGVDSVGNSGKPSCIEIKKDTTAPEIVPDSLSFVFTADNPYLGLQRTYTGNFSFIIKERNLDKDLIFVDFSDANTNQQSYIKTPDSCEQTDSEEYLCMIYNVNLFLESSTVKILFDMTDLAGNHAEDNESFTFPVDDEPPVPLEMTINEETQEPLYVGNVIDTIEVSFDEKESGMLPENVFLDIPPLTKIPANTCSQNNDEWVCIWNGISIGNNLMNNTITISLNLDTSDAYGNKINETITKNVIADVKPPELINFTVEQEDQPFPLNGSFFECKPIVMKAYVKEENPVLTVRLEPAYLLNSSPSGNSSLNYSNENSNGPPALPTGMAISVDESAKEDCVAVKNNTFYCEFVIPCIPPGKHDAHYIFEDVAKNKLIVNYTFDVLDTIETPTDYFYVAATERMPSAVDRSTAPYVNHRVLVLIALGKKENFTNASVVKVFGGACSGDTDFIQNTTLIDGSAVGEFPYLELILKRTDMPQRNLTLRCNISFYTMSVINGKKYVNLVPEVEGFPVTIPFFETQLPKEEVQEKINKIMDNFLVQQSWINSLKTVSDIATGACELYNSLVVLDQAAAASCVALGLGCPAETTTSGLLHIGSKDILKLCDYATCKSSLYDVGGIREKLTDFWSDNVPGWDRENVEAALNPRKSLVASFMFGCIPGMIENLERLRNIECSHAYCIQRMADSGMMTAIPYCDKVHSYEQCRFAGGEIEYWVPPVKFVEKTGAILKEMGEDPVKMFLGVSSTLCNAFPSATQPWHSTCVIVNEGPRLLTAITDVINLLFNNQPQYNPTVDYCGMVKNG